MYYCYILECSDGTYYTGWTKDPERRLKQHNLGQGAKYTRIRRPVKMAYVEDLPDQRSAMCREREIKTYTHNRKKELIASSQ